MAIAAIASLKERSRGEAGLNIDRESVRRSKIESGAPTGILRISLILATIGRLQELEVFLLSLESQHYPACDVILIDQNPPGFLDELLNTWKDRLKVTYIHQSERGLSRARNAGKPLATGDIIAIPDDDCWYLQGLLADVEHWFCTNPQYDVLAVSAQDKDGSKSGNRWFRGSCEIKAYNAFRTTFSPSLFFRNSEIVRQTQFDESLGIGNGSRFGAGEETDFVLKMLSSGRRGYLTRSFAIGHPRRDMLSGTVSDERAFSYGAGMGYVSRRRAIHGVWLLLVCYDALRCFILFARGKLAAARQCRKHLAGLVWGYLHG